MTHLIDFPNDGYAPLAVAIIESGETYGRNDSLTNHGETMVEFYDRRYNLDKHGQFTGGRYGLSTLLEHGPNALDLMGSVDAWTASEATMRSLHPVLVEVAVAELVTR